MSDYKIDDTIHVKFTTYNPATGLPFTLAGTPQVDVYEDNSTTQITTGVSITADFDGVTGLNEVQLVLSSGHGYEKGKSYTAVLSQGTVNGSSIAGSVIHNFTVEVSTPSAAALGNLEDMYDGTGYTDDTAPASRAQVDGISGSSGGALNFEAVGDNTGGAIKGATFVGSQTGTYANVSGADGTYHVIDHDTNDIDIVYDFEVGGSRTAVEAAFVGFLNGGNDDALIQAYDFVGTAWETRASLNGQSGTANQTITVPLLAKHTGTGADLGKVYIRILTTGSPSSPDLNVDQLLASAVSTNATIGYSGAAVWVDTNASNTSTESWVDGTADNPVSTLAAAKTIADNLNLKKFHFLSGSSETLATSYASYVFEGEEYTIDLNGQEVSGATFIGAHIHGSDDGSVTVPTSYHGCTFDDVTPTSLGGHNMFECAIAGDLVLAQAADYFWHQCYSGIAGTATPSVDFENAAEAKNLNIRSYSGGIEIKNFGTGTHTMSLEGDGQLVINANCTGDTVAIRGNFAVTDNAAGVVTLSDAARYDTTQVSDQIEAALDAAISELGVGAPTATPSIRTGIMLMYMALRNKLVVNTSGTDELQIHNDAGTKIAGKLLTDDGSDYTEAEMS